ncbi:MAG: hypothetical protein RJA48_380, partial [Verrucomicrobiota bacterium]
RDPRHDLQGLERLVRNADTANPCRLLAVQLSEQRVDGIYRVNHDNVRHCRVGARVNSFPEKRPPTQTIHIVIIF